MSDVEMEDYQVVDFIEKKNILKLVGEDG